MGCYLHIKNGGLQKRNLLFLKNRHRLLHMQKHLELKEKKTDIWKITNLSLLGV